MDIGRSTIPRVVQDAARRFASASALEDGDVRLSYAELGASVLRAARAFLAQGIERGDRVALWAPNVWEWIVAAAGLQSAGAVLVPLNTRMKGVEAGYILEKSGARMLCTVGEFLGTRYVELLRSALGSGKEAGRPIAGLPALERIVLLREPAGEADEASGILDWSGFLGGADRIGESVARARLESVAPDDLADILFTSGTTGKPKGVMCTHEQDLRCFLAWSEVVGLRAGERYLIVNPFFHSFGYKAGWLSAILRGLTILPHAVFDAAKVLERVGQDRVNVLPGPPTLYQSILALPDRVKYDVSSLRLAVTGAAAIPVELVRRMRSDLGFRTVITGYGLTESCGVATMCRDGDDPETIATTSGRSIPDVEVLCVDEAGHEVSRGEPGEVVIRGYNVMKGYFDDPAATAEAIDAQGWLHTGDIGVMDAEGNLRITDRIKDMFIVGGFNCYPAEIENILHAMPGVAHVAVVGVPDERMGEVGMAFVVPVPGAAVTPEGVISWCRENMANYKVPRHVRIVGELPMNATGKVTKFVLREQAQALFAQR
jgi:acyl-CoA synthetase (AMP-forming)/AMP-acid ligase II